MEYTIQIQWSINGSTGSTELSIVAESRSDAREKAKAVFDQQFKPFGYELTSIN